MPHDLTLPLGRPVRVTENRLMVEGVAAAELAERFGTPLFVTSEKQLRANVGEWRDAMAKAWSHGPTRVLVSLKANPSVALRRILTEEGRAAMYSVRPSSRSRLTPVCPQD